MNLGLNIDRFLHKKSHKRINKIGVSENLDGRRGCPNTVCRRPDGRPENVSDLGEIVFGRKRRQDAAATVALPSSIFQITLFTFHPNPKVLRSP